MTTSLADLYPVVDIDSHITEPPDLWTSRMPKEWGDYVPHVEPDPYTGIDRWMVGGRKLAYVTASAMAGWKEFPPSFPPSLDEADPAAWKADDRLARLDEYGIHAQVLYPNILAFQSQVFMEIPDQDIALACVQTYNDFLVEFCETDSRRLIPLMMLPFWNMDAALAEMRRAHQLGHRGVVFGSQFERLGLPDLHSDHWDPIYALAQELDISINFHIGVSARTEEDSKKFFRAAVHDKTRFVQDSALMFLGNSTAIADVILSGICERFPQLRFVSVESGASWLPFLVEALDWQWLNAGAREDFPGRLMPSEYFRRQIYGSFWFESQLLQESIRLYPDNMMFESDFPHPTSLSPGVASHAPSPRGAIDAALDGLPDDLIKKVLFENANRVYGLG